MFEAEVELEPLINLYIEDGFGMVDMMIVAAAHRVGIREVVTFDRKLARHSGVRLLVGAGPFNAH